MKNNDTKSNVILLFYLFFLFFILLFSTKVNAEAGTNTKKPIEKYSVYENIESNSLKDEIGEIKEDVAEIKGAIEGKDYEHYASFITQFIIALNIFITVLIVTGFLTFFISFRKTNKEIKNSFKSNLEEEIKKLKNEAEKNIKSEIAEIEDKLMIIHYITELYLPPCHTVRKNSACEQLAYRDKDGLSEMALQKIADEPKEDDSVRKKASWALEAIKAKMSRPR